VSLLRNITSGLRSLFQKEQVDQELDEEQASVGKRIWPFLKLYWQKSVVGLPPLRSTSSAALCYRRFEGGIMVSFLGLHKA